MADITHGMWVKDGKAVDAVYQDGKQVYGRNLIKGSYASSWGFSINGNGTTVQKVTMDSGEVALHVIGHDDVSGFWCHPSLPSSGIYTYSVEVKGTGTVSKLGWGGPSNISVQPTDDWQRVSSTASLETNRWYAFILYGAMDVYVRLLKVETGSVATPYSPAPEDVLK